MKWDWVRILLKILIKEVFAWMTCMGVSRGSYEGVENKDNEEFVESFEWDGNLQLSGI